MNKFIKATVRLMAGAVATAVLFVATPSNGDTILNIFTNGTTIVTNSWTVPAGQTVTTTTIENIFTNGATIVTNTWTVPVTAGVPYYVNGRGYTYGISGGYAGFFGATPVVKQTGVTNAPAVLATLTKNSATLTYLGVDGSTNSLSVITNVTINAIAGPPSTNTVNNLIGGLQNLGLVGN
jgi:hypothetical protein